MSSKTNLYSVTQLRTICDENLSETFGAMGYTESFKFIDLKLGLGLLTVALSGGLFLIEKKFSFYDSYYVTIMILGFYFIASGALWVLTSFKQYKNIKYLGYSNKHKITVSTYSTKYDPIYNIDLKVDDEVKSIEVKFMQLFDDFTNFHPEILQEILTKEIAKVSKKKQ